MTTSTPLHDRSGSDAGRRAQGAIAIVGLVAAVAVTVLLVATPVSSRPTNGIPTDTQVLPAGVRVDVQGGEPFMAYSTADRLSDAGASVGAVLPAGAAGADAGAEAGRETLIVYYDRKQQATAERIRDMLGRGTLRREHAFRPVVDVTIVLGKDLSRL